MSATYRYPPAGAGPRPGATVRSGGWAAAFPRRRTRRSETRKDPPNPKRTSRHHTTDFTACAVAWLTRQENKT